MAKTKNTLKLLNNNNNNNTPFYYVNISGLICRLEEEPSLAKLREICLENSEVKGMEPGNDPNY